MEPNRVAKLSMIFYEHIKVFPLGDLLEFLDFPFGAPRWWSNGQHNYMEDNGKCE